MSYYPGLVPVDGHGEGVMGTEAVHLRPLHRPVHPVRLITAASLFDGHDAAITIMRRLLQAQGAEVVHLGHNRSVDEVAAAAIAEDVQGVAVSSYQGGHMEYFTYLVERLAAHGRGDIRVYGGGGGVIVESEIAELEAAGVAKIFSPADGQRMGLAEMVNLLIAECDRDLAAELPGSLEPLYAGDTPTLARVITAIEADRLPARWVQELAARGARHRVPVLGVTGTGGAGKSSLTDEVLRRFRRMGEDKIRIAVLAVDPTRRRGGALLGDRIRMNAIDTPQVFFRSMATRGASSELPDAVPRAATACAAAGFDLVVVETPGIGQGDAAVVDVADVGLYVMTPEYGAPTQLEKIDMLELADVVAVNKADRPGAEDALRAVERQWRRDHLTVRSAGPDDLVPVFPTVASRFDDLGVTTLAQELARRLDVPGLATPGLAAGTRDAGAGRGPVIPAGQRRYLEQITAAVRHYHAETATMAEAAHRAQVLQEAGAIVEREGPVSAHGTLVALGDAAAGAVPPAATELVAQWRGMEAEPEAARPSRRSMSGTVVPKVARPTIRDDGELVRFLRSEHLPGHFPYTAGVFPTKREGEEPARMFAGEGDAARTNRRFHLLAQAQPATRLSVAFDSVTLYGRDPSERPDVYGKVGTSGVSIATVDDMKTLFQGFDLCDPTTSVSMTINGPAPTILAMFLVTAIDQRLEARSEAAGRPLEPAEAEAERADVLRHVRGTVQADILKEDQGQNTCIFSTDFSLQVMGDIQAYFTAHQMANFYSVSISGYHIAEAGANPLTQLAFTLANGFTYVEAYLARGMGIDDFAQNLSFFFSNGMDPEYTVIGRVARRIWAIAMRERYGAGPRSQKLKYHIQTSGRSLHAQEMAFNDIRTTLQALCAIYDNANSLHTNAFDEAVTTPTPDSVRRALAIQLIIDREWGLAMNENPLQGSFIVEQLTDLVEAAVLEELDRISERGGVLGAMETGYQRGRIQDDSMRYETAKHDGSLPIVGVNTFVAATAQAAPEVGALMRGTEEERQGQLARLRAFKERHDHQAPEALERLRHTVLEGGNVFAELMETVRVASLGQITEALFEVGGSYRRAV